MKNVVSRWYSLTGAYKHLAFALIFEPFSSIYRARELYLVLDYTLPKIQHLGQLKEGLEKWIHTTKPLEVSEAFKRLDIPTGDVLGVVRDDYFQEYLYFYDPKVRVLGSKPKATKPELRVLEDGRVINLELDW